MANCVYIEDQKSSEYKDLAVLSEDAHHCPCVPINHYARHKGFKVNKGSPGVVTYGAGPCLVVVLHNGANDTGCLAHINECTAESSSHDFADLVVSHMERVLTGVTNCPLELILLSGSNFFKTYAVRAKKTFEHFHVFSAINNGKSNYVYYPNHAQVFAVESEFVHGLTVKNAPKAVKFNRAETKFVNDPMIDFSDVFWKEFAARD